MGIELKKVELETPANEVFMRFEIPDDSDEPIPAKMRTALYSVNDKIWYPLDIVGQNYLERFSRENNFVGVQVYYDAQTCGLFIAFDDAKQVLEHCGNADALGVLVTSEAMLREMLNAVKQ